MLITSPMARDEIVEPNRIMKLKTWNWGAFLLCPIWSAFHGLYVGLWSLFIPTLLATLLIVSASKIPLISDVFFGFAILLAFLYLALSTPLIFLGLGHIEIPILKTEIIAGLEHTSGIGFNLTSVIYYLIWSIYIGIISNRWLLENKQKEDILKIGSNSKKWNTVGIILFVPIILAIGCITEWLLYQIMLLMFR